VGYGEFSMYLIRAVFCVLTLSVFLTAPAVIAANVKITRDGEPLATIYVPERIWDDPEENPEPSWRGNRSEEDLRRRLRESVRDFAGIIERMSGAEIEIKTGEPENDNGNLPILIAELAEERFGAPEDSYDYEQGFRITVTEDAIGFSGESDLATSYALYTLLDELGCRWYMPSELGEVLPDTPTISLSLRDQTSGPYTIYRGIWYTDNDYARRNRMGGMTLAAGHAIEHRITDEHREEYPDIRAIIDGEPHSMKLQWTHPKVAELLSDIYLSRLQDDPEIPTFSLSPMDGIGWDQERDPQYDAGDIDTSTGTVSKTDRLLVLANRVAERIVDEEGFSDVLFGFLAYVDYTRPPVREKPHPNLVPQIAPITYARAHPMTYDYVPDNVELQYIVEGWGDEVDMVSYYFYGWFLAEAASPNPMIRKWANDIQFVFDKGAARFWQPETLPNFESSMHALYMGNRMAWDPDQDPYEIIDELHDTFYGSAAEEMARYWHYVDSLWVDVPEFSGAGWGHMRRFTPSRLARMRELLDAAKTAAETEIFSRRIELADISLRLFEDFMQLRYDLAEGEFDGIGQSAEEYMDAMRHYSEKYQDQYAFGKVRWSRHGTINSGYFNSFYNRTYQDADRISTEHEWFTPPLLELLYLPDPDNIGESQRWYDEDFDDSTWESTDVMRETWSAIGLHSYMGTVWYRAHIDIPEIFDDADVRLWIGATDGSAKVFINGEHIPYVTDEGQTSDDFRGYATPASFDASEALRSDGSNQITIRTERLFLNELGTGGIMSPLRFYIKQ